MSKAGTPAYSPRYGFVLLREAELGAGANIWENKFSQP